jgi:hypothetical protein
MALLEIQQTVGRINQNPVFFQIQIPDDRLHEWNPVHLLLALNQQEMLGRDHFQTPNFPEFLSIGEKNLKSGNLKGQDFRWILHIKGFPLKNEDPVPMTLRFFQTFNPFQPQNPTVSCWTPGQDSCGLPKIRPLKPKLSGIKNLGPEVLGKEKLELAFQSD